jgi:uroporphyrinogen III methyltransferase/synthase
VIAARGIVYLVGAGPGDPGLITVRGLRLLQSADVVIHDRLIGVELLLEARRGARIIAVGKSPGRTTVPQEGINDLLLAQARAGKVVVRLKGGDPFIFGRGFEELTACRKAGVDCVVVPGVSSAIAAPASAGIPLTHRNLVRAFAVLTGRTGADTGAPEINYSALAGIDAVCLMMGRENLRDICRDLMHAGKDGATPAACVEWGTTVSQRVVKGTLATIADDADRAKLEAPIVTVLGAVAAFAEANVNEPEGTRSASAGSVSCAAALRPECELPLLGKRILVTRSRASSDALARLLTAAGATPIPCPLIRITYPGDDGSFAQIADSMERYDWVAFTSVHGVIGFFRRLRKTGRDVRSLAGVKVAAVGPATAAALRRRGIRADLVPDTYTAESLACTIVDSGVARPKRVLFPRGDQARPVLMQALRGHGIAVDDVVVYHTKAVSPPAAYATVVESGLDVITFYSPSAVRSWTERKLYGGDAAVACLGPTTADAARAAGLVVDVVAQPHTAEGLVQSLRRFFAARGGAA